MRPHPERSSREAAAPPAWLPGCRAGEAKAIAAMFEELLPVVERVHGRVVGPSPDLEDLVQATFEEAIRALPRFRGEASVKTWITSIAVHVAQHHLRAGRVRRHVSLELVPDERLRSAPEPHADSEQRLDERRLSAQLHALLDRITASKRVALLLFAIEGRSVEEVAALMGASQTATRSRVFFARRELRKLIAADPALSELAEGMLGRPAVGGEEP
jgi:RNA polymerase sigma-70 factor (ECF subfamily)